MKCPICAWSPLDPDYLSVFETSLWHIVLAPNQSLVGRCLIQLKRHCGDLAATTTDETLEWLNIVKLMENALRAAFHATMFNWGCYMNLAYREQPPAPHVHWWIVPRYDHVVKIGEIVFEDPLFGNAYDHSTWLDVPRDTRQEITRQLRQAVAQNDALYALALGKADS
jgi:ATP adenylyltransferase